MGKNIFILLLIVVVVGGVWYFASQGEEETPLNQNTNSTANENQNSNDSISDEGQDEGDVVEFIMTATNYEFSETEIRVKQGQTVRIKLVNEEGFHDWVIDEFDAATAQIQEGNEDIIEFVADEAGEFEYYCSVGQHRELGMVGTLIVE